MVRRKPTGHGPPVGTTEVPLGTSRPLGSEQDFFEERLGTDLSDVRVHADAEAAATADRLDARAFSVGSHIAFGRDEYRPQTSEGRKLIAHELAHVVSEDEGIRRNEDGEDSPEEEASEFDPCAVDVPSLDNTQLLQHFQTAEGYINRLNSEQRRGEDEYFDYMNLLRRLTQERAARAGAGHAWLNADVSEVPEVLYNLNSSTLGDLIFVDHGDTAAAAANEAVEDGILITPGQFQELLERENIPTVDPEEFFAQQDPEAPGPLTLPVPPRPQVLAPSLDLLDPFGLNQPEAFGLQGQGAFPMFGPTGTGVSGSLISPQTLHVFEPFARPVVTGGPTFTPEQVQGFQVDWRGDISEALYAAQDPETLRVLRDLNLIEENFPLYDPYDPRSDWYISIKGQLPDVPGEPGSLETTQRAIREIFAQGDPAKRANALSLLQQHIDANLTQDQLLMRTRVAVNPENVQAAQDSFENAIRRGPADYEPLLSAMMRVQSVTVRHKNGADVTYTEFGPLRDDFNAERISEARYRRAVALMANRARSQIISNTAGAETHLRPLLDYRQRYDFAGASEFQGVPDPAGRPQSRALQERLFRRIAVPELMEMQLGGVRPVLGRAGATGAGLGAFTTATLTFPHMVSSWDQDPYAGSRYLTNVGLGTLGGGVQATADQAFRIYLSQAALNMAASRAAAGQSVSSLSVLTPMARFTGSTLIGGFASGGITIGGMYLDERYFGADYTPIDYQARGTRAFVSGSVGAGVGVLASAGTAALLGAGGAGGACTVVLPGVGTVGCGAVGGAVGFVVGVGAYYLFDYTFGEDIESSVREAAGEQGCTGDSPTTSTTSSEPVSRPFQSAPFTCFAAGTRVSLPQGGTKPIEALRVGDSVLAYEPTSGRLQPARVQRTFAHPPERCLTIATSDGGRLRVTANHPLYTSDGRNGEWREAGCLSEGAILHRQGVTGGLERVAITSIEQETVRTAVYDITVADLHNFFAEAVLAHNKM